MRVFLTGATGFVGKSLTQRLLRDGHEVVAWVRDPVRARSTLGPEVDLVPVEEGDERLRAALDGCDGVVNLAGDPLFSGRWTRAKKRRMVTSRVDLTRRVVGAISAAVARPKVLVSASAIGIYGDRDSENLDESSAEADGYLADLCRDWEEAARAASDAGTRVACLRIGIVLGAEGGALAQMLPIFRLGLGGPLGSGNQYMSWIHIDDTVELVVEALENPAYEGVYNATAPEPVTNASFTRALGEALGRPAFLPAPGFAIRLLIGEAAGVLLGGQRVRPARAEALGFRFSYRTIEAALQRVVDLERSCSIELAGELPECEYLRTRGATYHLRQETRIDLPRSEVFEFFSQPENLGLLTPSFLRWEIRDRPPGPLSRGVQIDYRIGLGPFPLRWRTILEEWTPGESFCDAQHRGPYRSWWHEHHFEDRGDHTLVVDHVFYSPPLGLVGRLANFLFVAPTLRRIFGYRAEALARRLPTRPPEVAARSGARPGRSHDQMEALRPNPNASAMWAFRTDQWAARNPSME
jgi:uncharacterized protein (TIGR01777 family)